MSTINVVFTLVGARAFSEQPQLEGFPPEARHPTDFLTRSMTTALRSPNQRGCWLGV